jgi:alpha-tubulin suppressor-like RCC1 family protein
LVFTISAVILENNENALKPSRALDL